MVRCPCHADRTPSLSLSEGDNGKLIWFCHAGCGQQEVARALSGAAAVTSGIAPDRWQAHQAELREFARRIALEVAA
jgi:hypothetical protein